jgi:hypothetical protein
MTESTAPLTTTDIDLKGFPGFVLDVERLLASELVALGTAEEISAALMLWCRAWQQSPPGSLPNDERVLAAFSKAKNWKKVREMALRGFVLCSDGRLYHRFVCKQVLDAWSKRTAYRDKRDKEAERLRDWREKKQAGNAHSVPNEPRFDDEGNASRNDSETRFKVSTKHVRREGEGEVEGKEKGREVKALKAESLDISESAASPSAPTPTPQPSKKAAPAENPLGTRLPVDWKPSQADVEYCKTERPDLKPSLVATNFYDYWIAKPGKDGRKADWSATWRSWVRKESAAAAPRSGLGQLPPKPTLAELNAANNREAKRLLGIPENDDEARTINAI